jgi:hypothetical protein
LTPRKQLYFTCDQPTLPNAETFPIYREPVLSIEECRIAVAAANKYLKGKSLDPDTEVRMGIRRVKVIRIPLN